MSDNVIIRNVPTVVISTNDLPRLVVNRPTPVPPYPVLIENTIEAPDPGDLTLIFDNKLI